MIKAVIFDYGFTLHNHETDDFYPGGRELLDYLKENNFQLALVSRAPDVDKRWNDFKRLKLESWFNLMDVVPKGTTKEFSRVLNEMGVKPEETIVVGDRIKSEIIEGNKIGCITIWFRQEQYKYEFPENKSEEPNFTIYSLSEVAAIIKKLNS